MDMYLRILKGIDLEVVDRDVIRTQQVNFVYCFYIYVIISMGENKPSTKRGRTIKQKLITYSIRTIYCTTSLHLILQCIEPVKLNSYLAGVYKAGFDCTKIFIFA